MATAAQSAKSTIERERAFFFYMAIAMGLILAAGFAFNLAMGRSSFAVPLIYHVHAFVFFGWTVLFVLQSGLAATGSVALHRRLGVLALVWIPVMVAMGTALTVYTLRSKGGAPFFDENEFLFGAPLAALAFAGLALSGLAMRARSDWHRRLMCCSMIAILGPGVGRLLPSPFLIPWAWWISNMAVPMIFPVIGMIADRRRIGRVHQAWFWGIGVLVGSQLIADAIAYSPVGISITKSVVAGTPGAERTMEAHFP
jgi:hypothetical protein